ncbi:M23 family metallopeptidase [Kitasatospora terrestris]|uniref:M23ase beta-sheet core domain-containing protein n=1 Tax=Kitasatospora terrestris TaxID=258051 RepID=A0ABP9DLX8_9ACTN
MAPTTRTGNRGELRAERRARARSATRTAVLTVALPSAATLGVFAAAAVAVHQRTADRPTPSSGRGGNGATDARAGTGLAGTDVGGAGRHQAEQRAEQQEAVRRQLARREAQRADRERADHAAPAQRQAEAEAARPRYALPVEQHGLSAGFGQTGAHWTARHTGIDFPVATGTPVRAVTDGTVSTRWSSAYGYLATVTAPDGTQTWYGHLRSYRVRKGPVRAGDVIAYSGSTGNSTGPHLHFEVRPDGEDPVDPVPWLLGHGLDPR